LKQIIIEMKKLIGILVVLFITTGVFGQKFIRDHSFIETTPTGNNTIEDAINRTNIEFTNFNWIHYVHFVKDDKLFLLSYEPIEDLEVMGFSRSIYLYSKDIHNVNSPWEKASDVVMTNYWGSHNNHNEVDFYIYDENKHNSSVGKVVVRDDGCVEMTISWELFQNGRQKMKDTMTVIFTPVGNNKYDYQWQ